MVVVALTLRSIAGAASLRKLRLEKVDERRLPVAGRVFPFPPSILLLSTTQESENGTRDDGGPEGVVSQGYSKIRRRCILVEVIFY